MPEFSDMFEQYSKNPRHPLQYFNVFNGVSFNPFPLDLVMSRKGFDTF